MIPDATLTFSGNPGIKGTKYSCTFLKTKGKNDTEERFLLTYFNMPGNSNAAIRLLMENPELVVLTLRSCIWNCIFENQDCNFVQQKR